jgi:hypothetical protein
MSELQSAPNLGAFDERYEIVSELSGPANAHLYMARRREDGAEVMITVVSAQGGGENNAIAHFASDAQALTGLNHPSIPRVLEGAWTGKDSFAVVSERVSGATLFELLSAGEVLPNTRIAVALRDIKDVLIWAREHNIVHRGVSPETVYFEPETQSLRMLLELTPIPLEGLPDACSDARTLGSLAWTMLTGQAYSETSEQSLGDLRPDLAKAVVEETTAILDCDVNADEPDVERFVSVIAMADVLRQGEIEVAQMQAELVEERRVDHRRLEAEGQAAADRAAVIIERLHKERADFEERIAQDEARIANDEKQIAAGREQLEKERQELAACAADLERERASAEQAAEQAAERAAERAAAAAASTPAPEAAAAERPVLAKGPTTANTHVPAETTDATPVPTGDHVEDEAPRGARRFGWIVPVGAVATLLLLILVGSLITWRRSTAPATIRIGRTTIVPRGPESASGIVPRGGFLNQTVPSVGDTTVRPDTTALPDTTPVSDTTPARDTTPVRTVPVHRNAIVRRTTPVRPDTAVARESTIARDTTVARDTGIVRDTAVRVDTTYHRGTPTVRRDTTPRRDTAVRDATVRIDTTYHRGTPTVVRDTAFRRDTTFHRDSSVRRDTTVRRDSTGRPPPGGASFLRR